MEKYSTVIFDLDDTLIDNTKACNYAFRKVLEYLNINYSDNIFNEFLKHDAEYWYKYENGLMIIPDNLRGYLDKSRTYLRANRFLKFFNISNFELGIILNDIYCSNLGIDIEEIDGAKEIIEYLNDKYKIMIATNGPYEAALNKINEINIKDYIRKIYCSETIGSSKPKPDFWDKVFNDLKVARSEVILIGDSLTTDVASGNLNGFDTIWYNPNNIANSEKYIPTYEINNLLKLKRRL